MGAGARRRPNGHKENGQDAGDGEKNENGRDVVRIVGKRLDLFRDVGERHASRSGSGHDRAADGARMRELAGAGRRIPFGHSVLRQFQKRRIFPARVETRAGLIGIVVVTGNRRKVIARDRFFRQPQHRPFLRRRARVFRLPLLVGPANIDIAERARIASGNMRADARLRPAVARGAVEVNDLVIADAGPSALSVPAVDFLHRDLTPLRRRGAMPDELIDLAHHRPPQIAGSAMRCTAGSDGKPMCRASTCTLRAPCTTPPPGKPGQ